MKKDSTYKAEFTITIYNIDEVVSQYSEKDVINYEFWIGNILTLHFKNGSVQHYHGIPWKIHREK